MSTSLSAAVDDDLQHLSPTTNAARAFSTAWVFLAAIALSAILTSYANSHFLSREALETSLAGRLSPDRIDAQYAQMKAKLWVSYAILPLYVGLRVGLAALVLQLVFLAGGIEIRLAALVRACTLAYFAMIANTAVDIWTIANPGAVRGVGSLQVLVSPTASPGLLFLAHTVSVFEVAWCVLVILLIKRVSELKYRAIAISVFGAWAVITGIQVAAVAYIARVVR
jgi:hypothetical protein